MARVFIGVGHGGTDPGAVGYLVEKDVNLKMAKACCDYLQARGIDTRISRTGDVTDKLVSKIDRCNAFAPDLALDIHNNAGGGDGFEIFHSVVGGKGKELAQNIEKEVVKIGQNSRGLKTKKNSYGRDYFGFIRSTICPAVICEGVFVDNKADAAHLVRRMPVESLQHSELRIRLGRQTQQANQMVHLERRHLHRLLETQAAIR